VRTLYISEWYFGCSVQPQLHCDFLLLVFYSSPPLQHRTSANVFRNMWFFFSFFFVYRSQHTRDPCTACICSSAIQFNTTQTDTNQHHCQLPARCVGKDETCRYMWAYSFCLCYQFLTEASNFKLYTYSWSVNLYFFLYPQLSFSPFLVSSTIFSCKTYCFFLKIEAAFLIFIIFYQSVYHHIPEDSILQIVCLKLQQLHMAAVS